MTDHDKLRVALRYPEYTTQGYGHTAGSIVLSAEAYAIIRAAAESTLPRAAVAEVWRAEYCTAQTDGTWLPQCQQFHTRAQRDERVEFMRQNPQWFASISVSGPHRQAVPA